MSSRLEFNSRAALCRELARHEPAHQALWMAEAENWSRLSKEKHLERRRFDAHRDGRQAATRVLLLAERVSGLIRLTLKRRSNI